MDLPFLSHARERYDDSVSHQRICQAPGVESAYARRPVWKWKVWPSDGPQRK
jgi:hypothetical protein